MTFYGLSPLMGLLLGLGALAILTATHFLHRRYQRVTVPALRFWSAALKRHRQDTLTGRFRHPLTWLLLCGLAGLLILGMLQPGPTDPHPWVVVLDCRASMSLPTDHDTSRLERSQQLIHDFLRRSASLKGVTLIAVDETAHVLTQSQDSKAETLYQLQQCTVGTSTSEQGMHQALKLVTALQAQDPRTGVLLCTDHLTNQDLPQDWQVLNVAQDLDNLALLKPEVIPETDGTYRYEVWLAHWGKNPSHVTLELMQGQQIKSLREVTLAPTQMQAVAFTVQADEISTLWARAQRDEPFVQDNQIEPVAWQRCRLFLTQPTPLPLQAAIQANPAYLIAPSADQADVCVQWAQGDPCDMTSYQSIEIRTELCSDREQRQAWMSDLFVAPHPVTIKANEQDEVLLQTSSGQALASRSRTHPAILTLSPSLFDDQATFWKQAQFLPLLDAMLVMDHDDTDRPWFVTSHYSDLTQPDSDSTSTIKASRGQSLLATWVLILALLLGLWELYCFYWGKIV